MSIATSGKEVLAQFFDEGAYTTLYADAQGAVTAAFGSANGEPVYAICQNGAALAAKDTQKAVKVMKMAAKTGNPVVTFYNSVGAKLEEGLDALSASANMAAAVSRLSGVVPQIAVVTGVCGAGAALAAAGADICIMSKEGELFLTAPFTSAAKGDKVADAGSADYAAK
ncbi:MAG: carboxyl transferase domain-containing protein, partial [Ruthenibacterium sp.]